MTLKLSASTHNAHDVLLADGSTARIRPMTADDKSAAVDLHGRLSQESVCSRYFGAHPKLSADELSRLVEDRDPDHLALVAERAGQLIGVAQYDRVPGTDLAEIALVVDDAYQGQGVGTLLLEFLAHEGRAHGFRRFAADTQVGNNKMLKVLLDAGYRRNLHSSEGVIRVVMDISPNMEALAALYERDRKATARSMRRLLRPRSVAVIGASRSAGTVGHELVRNLVSGGFQGAVYPVNPAASSVASVPCYPNIAAVPTQVDLAIIAVPARAVLKTVEECGEKGVGGLVIVSSHFAEDGSEGAQLERQVAQLAHSYGMRVVGPNCFGVLNTDPEVSMNATFAKDAPTAGVLGFASQSGGLGIAILAEAKKRGIGLSSFVSMGNKADVSGNDLLAWWSEDEATRAGLLYLESFGNPRKFARLARQLSRSKPVIAVKSGRSAVGRRAASSHTAAMASSDEAVAALFHQTGVIRVSTVEELFDVGQVVSSQPLGGGMKLAVLSNVGGPGVLAVDAAESNGLEVPEFSDELQARLRELCPRNGGVTNPIDLGAEASATMYRAALDLLLSTNEVDAVLVHFTPPLVNRKTADVAAAISAAVDHAAARADTTLFDDRPQTVKPVVASLLGADDDGAPILQEARYPVPSFTYPETAVRALAHALRYAAWRARPEGKVPTLTGVDVAVARGRLASDDGVGPTEGWLSGGAALEVLADFGIPVLKAKEVFSAEEASKVADDLGYPVVLKVLGPVHKSDGGGVKLALSSSRAVENAYTSMLNDFGTQMQGALVQPMAAQKGVETIVGGIQEPSFGPLVLFGIGGVAVEVLNDHMTRLAPLTDLDAQEMVCGLKGSALLTGYRGQSAVDVPALRDVLHRVGRLLEELPEVLELDCNPVIATASGALVIDARLRIGSPTCLHLEDTRHLR